MHLTDPIADMLTRIRNANVAKHDTVKIPFSKIKESLANILKSEGYINSFEVKEEGTKKDIVVSLKYMDGEAVIKGLRRISKPGRRVYTSVESLPKVLVDLELLLSQRQKGLLQTKNAESIALAERFFATCGNLRIL